MFQEYLAVIAQGIPTSLLLTVVALFIAFFLALGLTFLLSIGNKLVKSAVNFASVFSAIVSAREGIVAIG